MKRITGLFIILITILTLISCRDNSKIEESNKNTITTYSVSFIVEGKLYSLQEVSSIDELVLPREPQKSYHDFMGWYYDEDFQNEFKIDDEINKDLTLYAKLKDYRDDYHDFTVSLILEDKHLTLSSSLDKLTILSFWYNDCMPCKEELPLFNEALELYDEEIQIIAIHEYTTYKRDNVIDFINKSLSPNRIIFGVDDSNNSISKAYGVKSFYPVTVFINTKGKITYTKNGAFRKDELFSVIDLVLKNYM